MFVKKKKEVDVLNAVVQRKYKIGTKSDDLDRKWSANEIQLCQNGEKTIERSHSQS